MKTLGCFFGKPVKEKLRIQDLFPAMGGCLKRADILILQIISSSKSLIYCDELYRYILPVIIQAFLKGRIF